MMNQKSQEQYRCPKCYVLLIGLSVKAGNSFRCWACQELFAVSSRPEEDRPTKHTVDVEPSTAYDGGEIETVVSSEFKVAVEVERGENN